MKRNTYDAIDGVSRRSVLTLGITVGVGTIAGCLGTTDETEEETERETGDDVPQGDVGSEISEETRALAAEMVETIDDDLSVADWQFHSMFVPEYTDSGGLEADVQILGDAYADIVDRGFDYRSMPTALDENEITDFMVFLEPEWATAYLTGDWSKETYYAEIEASTH
ncbi:hypothetical protein [Natrinema caseinilyticum]|uniref:hypothetical protein n=1 Tax=Natrinema caseinilyticum TaxID=2961570 RepID=UPI0020C4DE45|nr:hypothetical protein [Natrinema caseinilyticum]